MSNLKWAVPLLMALGFAAAGQPSLSQDAQAQAKVQKPSVTDTTPAREAETYSDDIRLTNRCIDRGGKKAECLCVVQVLKYELSMGEYHRVAAGNVPLATNGRPDASGTAASNPTDLRQLSRSADFGDRCAVARRYFRGATS